MRRMVRDWHGAEPEFTGNVATEYGTFHEAGALAEYQMETGNAVTAEGFVTREDWAGCSPDGLIGLTGGLEIKCPFGKRKMGAGDTFKPLSDQPHYHDQIQFSLWVCERAWWDFFQWAPGATELEKVKEDWAGCSPDGLIGLTGGLEIKCPFGKRKMVSGPYFSETFKPLSDQPHYHDQIQFSLWVCERAWWDFFQWAPGATALEQVKPCSKWRASALPKLRQFYAEYLHERELPHAEPHLEPLRVSVDTPEAARLMAEYDDLTEAMDKAKERRAEVQEAIVALAGGRNAFIAGRKVTKVEKAGSVSYAKALAKYAPDADLDPFRGKPSTSWRIT